MRRQEVSKINADMQVSYRRSRIRSSILKFLRTTNTHPSAEEVHQVVRATHPKVSFGTVYRNLNILVDQGEIDRLESSRGRDRFDAHQPFHAHFRCDSCGKIYDLPVSIDRMIEELSDGAGHVINGQRIEFYGVCADCAVKKED